MTEQNKPYKKRRQNRKPKGIAINGWLNFYKPVGMTSAQAVAMVKKHFNAQKVGHGGTLDPLAEGVLPLAFGQATKTMQFCLEADKAYRFTIQFGSATTTDDSEGEIIKTSDERPRKDAIEQALSAFIGPIEQLPPLFSALKVNGKRAYDLARAGEEFELEKRPVTIHDFALESVEENDSGRVERATFSVLVSKGTYVRSLARDIGEALTCFGHICYLQRTKAGAFELDTAIAQENLDNVVKNPDNTPQLQPVGAVLDDIPALVATAAELQLLKMGQTLMLPQLEAGRRQVTNDQGRVCSVIDIADDGAVQVVRNFM